MSTLRKNPLRRAFTFVELVIGMLVTSIVLSALAVFTFGVSDNWTQSDSSQSAFLRQTMAVERLRHMLREAQLTETNPTPGSLNNSTTPAACMLWTDANGDGHIQYSELSMLQYIPATQKLVIWSIPATSSNASQTTLSIPSEASFLALPNVASAPLADNIQACQIFCTPGSSPTLLPSIEVILEIPGSNSSMSSQLLYTTVALRAPNLNPN
jgi:Tfp pilus assembly protein PilW